MGVGTKRGGARVGGGEEEGAESDIWQPESGEVSWKLPGVDGSGEKVDGFAVKHSRCNFREGSLLYQRRLHMCTSVRIHTNIFVISL